MQRNGMKDPRDNSIKRVCIYGGKRRGPRTGPCGTPHLRTDGVDNTGLIQTTVQCPFKEVL